MRKRKAASYRPAWRFPAIIEHEIAKWILSPSLHVCSDRSTLCDVKLDLYELPAPGARGMFVRAAARYLPFRRGGFASVVWDPPYSMRRLATMPALVELRSMLRPQGRLITVHYFDPSGFFSRSMRLLYKAYYDPKAMGGVRVVTVLELLPGWRLKPGRRDRLIDVTQRSEDQLVPVPPGIWEPESLSPVIFA